MASPTIGYAFTYYDNGWLKTVSDGTRTTEYLYDVAGRRDLVTIRQGEAVLATLDYVYDPVSKRLQQIVSAAGTFTFGYDAWGRRATLTYPNGVTANYSYNGQTDWLTGIDYQNLNLTVGYPEHDAVGNRKSRVEDGTATTYAYDDTYQLTKAKTGASEENFVFDTVGNRESGPTVKDVPGSYAHDAANRMTQGRKVDYEYDDFGNQTKRIMGAGKEWVYTWNGANQLTEAKLVDDGATLRTVTFKYDPFGQRIEKKTVDGTVTTTHSYLYDGEDIALEYVDDGSTTTTTHYVHGPGIDEPLAMVRSGQSYYYHTDGLGSIVAISDNNRAIVQRYKYESFGLPTASNPTFENPYTYTSREYDKEIGLIYERNRYADLMGGRYISKDPIGFVGGDANLYRRVGNDPVNWIDPWGLSALTPALPIGVGFATADGPLLPFGDIIGGAIIAGAAIYDYIHRNEDNSDDGNTCDRPRPYAGETPDDVPEKFRPSGAPGRLKNDDGSIWEKDRDGHGGSKWKRWPNERDRRREKNRESIRPDGSVR